jgi:hypothetical protein
VKVVFARDSSILAMVRQTWCQLEGYGLVRNVDWETDTRIVPHDEHYGSFYLEGLEDGHMVITFHDEKKANYWLDRFAVRNGK